MYFYRFADIRLSKRDPPFFTPVTKRILRKRTYLQRKDGVTEANQFAVIRWSSKIGVDPSPDLTTANSKQLSAAVKRSINSSTCSHLLITRCWRTYMLLTTSLLISPFTIRRVHRRPPVHRTQLKLPTDILRPGQLRVAYQLEPLLCIKPTASGSISNSIGF